MDFKKIQSYTFIGALIGITIIFAWMLRPYLYPVFWAAVIAALFRPVYIKILVKIKKPDLATSITLALILLIFIVPLAGLISLIIQQAISVYKDFGTPEAFQNISTTIEGYLDWPFLQRFIGDVDILERLTTWSSSISKAVYQFVAASGQNTVRLLIQFFIMLYTLYYFIRDGKKILINLMHLVPLGDKKEKELYDRFVSTAKATLKGTLLIGVIQGIIGSIAFFIVGVPAAVFWGVIMIVLSIIPGLGAAIILLPGTIILLMLGNFWQAAVVIVAMVIAGFIDNVLRGPLVGKDTQMHPLLIFFATLGGLLSFGISGVVIGPVITAFFLSMWKMYEQKYKVQLDKAD
ncbi:MAG: AI-2E family transporter [bacterium]|nr:AI-2E family transporter [bacterium]